MQIAVLGPLQVFRRDAPVDLGARKPRALLAALALTPGQAVSTDALVELLWPQHKPSAVAASLHGYVAALRRVLEPGRAARGRPDVLLTTPAGYELRIAGEHLDAIRFREQVAAAHQRLSDVDAFGLPAGLSAAGLQEMSDNLEVALRWWRGPAYPELEGAPAAEAERTRLTELRLMALADSARARLSLGEHAAVAATLGQLTAAHPTREDLWALHALALVRAERQAEALDSLQSARRFLAEELGIDPGSALQNLEIAILRQDPALRWHAPGEVTAVIELPSRPTGAPRPSGIPGRPDAAGGAQEFPLVGRGRELAALLRLMEAAHAGAPQFATLLGEPGIGKTRLTSALTTEAIGQDFAVLLGRCSSDEGAPPLWPWTRVLAALRDLFPGVEVPDFEETAEPTSVLPAASAAARFRSFDAVARTLTQISAEHPLLLIFEDLHWADTSSLRLLRHVGETVHRGRLLVVATQRSRPPPTGALAELAEALARRGALRVDLAGLAADDVTALARVATDTGLDGEEVAALQERTGGNPFFVLEVLRLRRSTDSREAVPAAIGDVIAARLGQLQPEAQRLLRLAAVQGVRADLGLLARMEGKDEEAVLDMLEPALATGLMVETAGGLLQFSHALVRDAVYTALGPLRRQRRHAEIAQLLAAGEVPGSRLAEIARHWLGAGPRHASRAWRAAADAAAYASSLHAHEEAADLLAAALSSQRADPAASPLERYDVLMARAHVCRMSADMDGQRAATTEAIQVADAVGDVERLALAAVSSSEGALWSNRPQGEVDQLTVAALHRAVRDMPGGDTPLRCRSFLALSREMYWGPGSHERKAYAERGLAMARRLDDPRLRAWACHTAFVADFQPRTLEVRIALAAEAVACSRTAAEEEGEAIGRFWQAIAAGEAGRMEERTAAVRQAMTLAESQRLRYLQVMLGTYEVPWLALGDQLVEAEQLLEQAARWGAYASFPFLEEALAGARLGLELWRNRTGALLPTFTALDESSSVDLGTAILLLLLRSGHVEEAQARIDRSSLDITGDAFDAPLRLAVAAEAAFLLRRSDLAGAVYAVMAPWAGRTASAGTGTPLGPVDSFLALAAAGVGEQGLATRHADDALELCRHWQLPAVARWLRGHRHHGSF